MMNDKEPLPIASALLSDLRLTYRVGDALEITTNAVHPQSTDAASDDDAESDDDGDLAGLIAGVAWQATFDKHKETLQAAVLSGEVTVLNPLDKMPHTHPLGNLLLNALIPRDELQRFARQKLRIELTEPERFQYTTDEAGLVSTTVQTPEQHEAELQEKRERHARGEYIGVEAVQALADVHGLDAPSLHNRMEKEFCDGNLTLREPRNLTPRERTDRRASMMTDYVFPADVDKLLAHWGVPYRFPTATANSAAFAPAAASSVQAVAPKRTSPAEAGTPAGVSTSDVAVAFGGVYWPIQSWKRNLDDYRAEWITKSGAKLVPGKKGHDPQQAKWNPVRLAHALLIDCQRWRKDDFQSRLRAVDDRFKGRDELAHWREHWAAKKRDINGDS